MKGFMLVNGDLSITNGEIDMVSGNSLTAQTIQSVLSTNKGEWLFNAQEGIDFNAILGEKRVKANAPSAKDGYYLGEISSIKSKGNALSERLRMRLDGE